MSTKFSISMTARLFSNWHLVWDFTKWTYEDKELYVSIFYAVYLRICFSMHLYKFENIYMHAKEHEK